MQSSSLRAAEPASLLRVVSYNVHRCIGRDGRLAPERIVSVLDELRPDVVGLQEVHSQEGRGSRAQQVQYLAEATGMVALTGPTLRESRSRYGNVLLTRLPVLHVRRHDLSVGGCEPRGAVDADLWIGGRALRVVVTHLGLGAGERRLQTKRLLRILSDPPSRSEIVLGDLNEWFPYGAPLRWLRRRLGHLPARRSFPSSFPIFSLDRILVRPGRAVQRLSAHRSALAGVASDHLPLVADLHLDALARPETRERREARGTPLDSTPVAATILP